MKASLRDKITPFLNKRYLLLFFFLGFCFFLCYFIARQYILETNSYKIFGRWYANILGNASAELLNCFGYKAHYYGSSDQLIVDDGFIQNILPRLRLRLFLLAFLFPLFIPKIYRNKISVLVAGFFVSLCFLFFVSVARFSIDAIYQRQDFLEGQLTNLILYLSNNILHAIGYASYSVGRYIFLEKNWVFLANSCLGIGLIATFIFLIFIIKSNWINKILYMLVGTLFIILMNALRISLLLVYVYKNNGNYSLSVEVHDLSNYFFYVIVFVLFLLYVYWFQNIHFGRKKKI